MRAILPIVALAGCYTTQQLTARSRADAEQRLAAGDLDGARAAYQRLAAESDDPYSDLAVRQGLAGIDRAAIARSIPTLESLAAIHGARVALRAAGGDPELDDRLVAALRLRARLDMAAALDAAVRGDVLPALAAARAVAGYPDLEPDITAPLAVLASQAGAIHWKRADAAGAAHPLARRFHRGMAASYVGGQLDDTSALLAPFQRAVTVDTGGPDPATGCDALAERLRASLATGSGPREVDVVVRFESCSSSERHDEAPETVSYTARVPVTTTRSVPRYDCHDEPMTTTYSVCGIDSSSGDARYACEQRTVELGTRPVCTKTYVDEEVTTFHEEPRTATRTVTRWTATAAIRGSFVVRHDGVETTGRLDGSTSRDDTTYPALEVMPGKDRDAFATPAALLDGLLGAAVGRIDEQIGAALGRDLQAAAADAARAAAAGRIDDEEEALIRGVLLGAPTAGALTARYGVEPVNVRDAFSRSFPVPVPVVATLPPVTEIGIDTGWVERYTPSVDRKWLPPLRTGHLRFDGTVLAFDTTTAAGPELGGSGGVAGEVRAGLPLLGWLRGLKPYGFQLADDAELGFGLGLQGVSGFGLAITASARYTIAIGGRGPAGALFVGLRPNALAVKLGGDSGRWASVPLYARVELGLGGGAFTGEAWGLPLAGRDQWGVSLYRSIPDRGRSRGVFSLRRSGFFGVELAHGATGFCGGELLEECTDVDGVGLTTLSLVAGRGL